LLAGASQAIGKRLWGRIVGTSVAPEFVPKRNSELSGSRGLGADDAVRLEIGARSGSALATDVMLLSLRVVPRVAWFGGSPVRT